MELVTKIKTVSGEDIGLLDTIHDRFKKEQKSFLISVHLTAITLHMSIQPTWNKESGSN
jgi:hypothetical protein